MSSDEGFTPAAPGPTHKHKILHVVPTTKNEPWNYKQL